MQARSDCIAGYELRVAGCAPAAQVPGSGLRVAGYELRVTHNLDKLPNFNRFSLRLCDFA